MKQKTTKFEKSSARQFAYLFLGIGAIGLALTVGGNSLGFNLGATSAWIMLLGFAVATVFLFLAGGSVVPVGNEEYEVEDRIQVVMSDDLSNAIKSNVERAVTEISTKHEAALVKFEESASEFAKKINDVQETIDKANVGEIGDQLAKLTSAIDLETTADALGNLKTSMNAVVSNLDDLSTLSSDSTNKLETLLTEVTENLSTSNEEIKSKSSSISTELDATLKSLSAFNSI